MRATLPLLTPLLWITAPLMAAFIAPATAPAQERVAVAASCPEAALDDAASTRSARQLYRRGERLYAAGRYRDAVLAYRAALSRSGEGTLLFDLANTYERMGQHARAADALVRYLSCVHPPDAELVRQRIRSLRRRALPLAARPADGATPVPAHYGRLARARPWLIGAAGAGAAALLLHLAARAARPPACASLVDTRPCQVRDGIDWSSGLDRAAAVGAVTSAVGLAVGGLLLVRPRGATGPPDHGPGNPPVGAMLVVSGSF